MKKIISILSVIIMLLSPIGFAQTANHHEEIKTINHIQKPIDTKNPPDWATGEFNGT